MATILQSEPWARFQQRIGHTVVRAHGEGWHYLATVEGGRGGRYLYCPYGPVAESPQAFDRALEDLRREARQRHCWFARIEPVNAAIQDGIETPHAALRRRGLVRAPRQVQPDHTQVIDLSRGEQHVLKDMKSTNRNLYRNIHKKGVQIRRSSDPADVEHLLRFLDDTARRKDFHRQHDDYLRTAAQSLIPDGAAAIYLAELDGQPIAASLVYDSDDTRTYAHAAMDPDHRKLSAGIPLVVTMILDALREGKRWFDLYGTAPQDAGPEHEWYGFTSFKKSFGGTPVTHPGTWDLPVSRPGYAAYTGVRAAREGLTRARKAARGTRDRLAARRAGAPAMSTPATAGGSRDEAARS